MKKFTVTRLSELEPGDRFYFPKYKYNICTFMKTSKFGFVTTMTYEDHNIKHVDTEINRKVVFLRNINE